MTLPMDSDQVLGKIEVYSHKEKLLAAENTVLREELVYLHKIRGNTKAKLASAAIAVSAAKPTLIIEALLAIDGDGLDDIRPANFKDHPSFSLDGADQETFTVSVTYGHFETIGYKTFWHHNPALEMSYAEQFAHNTKHIAGFKAIDDAQLAKLEITKSQYEIDAGEK